MRGNHGELMARHNLRTLRLKTLRQKVEVGVNEEQRLFHRRRRNEQRGRLK